MCCTPLCVNKHKEGKQDLSPPTICVVQQYLSPPTLCVNKHKEGKQDLSPPTICVVHYTMCKQTQRR